MKPKKLLKKAIAASCAVAMTMGMTTVGASAGEEKTTVKLAVLANWVDWCNDVIAEYEAANPDIEIELIEVANSSDLYTKMAMMMQSSETAPDVISEDGFMIKSDAAAGYLEPLDDVLAEWEDWSQFETAIADGAKGSDGKQYAVPFSTDTQGIWYDKTLFEQAGLDVPFEPKSWADILDAAKKLKELGDDITPFYIYASKTSPEETSMRTFQTLYSGTGSQLYDSEEGKWVVDQAALETVLGFVNDVFNVEQVGESLSLATTSNIENQLANVTMQEHKLGMYITGSWLPSYWVEGKDGEWPEALDYVGFAKVPTVDGSGEEYTTMCGGWTWAIPANANNKEEGIEFLKFLASKENQLSYALDQGVLAVRKDVGESEEYLSQPLALPDVTNDMLQYGHFRPTEEGYSSVSTLYTEMVENVALSGMSVEDAITDFTAQLKATVGDDLVLEK